MENRSLSGKDIRSLPVPVLETMLLQFPFIISGFHSDNGSEFVNRIRARREC